MSLEHALLNDRIMSSDEIGFCLLNEVFNASLSAFCWLFPRLPIRCMNTIFLGKGLFGRAALTCIETFILAASKAFLNSRVKLRPDLY